MQILVTVTITLKGEKIDEKTAIINISVDKCKFEVTDTTIDYPATMNIQIRSSAQLLTAPVINYVAWCHEVYD